ncbi:hypothetical protein QVD17_31062 [Tagetes erecta]|uniref:Uncharacterized protein n=1 Tax=Tagetes erecta TaxID=13708 RepID=A0AAD8K2Q1_TARER|nr:hypothetical protein QVD17_31062 [Tagetes erecta]
MKMLPIDEYDVVVAVNQSTHEEDGDKLRDKGCNEDEEDGDELRDTGCNEDKGCNEDEGCNEEDEDELRDRK